MTREEILSLTLLELDDMTRSLKYAVEGKVPPKMMFADRKVIDRIASVSPIPREVWIAGAERGGKV